MKRLILVVIVASIGLLKTSFAQEEAVKWYSFEEALELAKVRVVYKPTMACTFLWLTRICSLSFSGVAPAMAMAQDEVQKAEILVEENSGKEEIVCKSFSFKPIPKPEWLPAVVSVAFVIELLCLFIGMLPKSSRLVLKKVFFFHTMPRAPPTIAVGRSASKNLKPISSPSCQRRKGE